jgi:hypothetical protein
MPIFGQLSTERKVRSFSLAPTFLETFRGKQPAWGPLGYVTYVRTYSRIKADGGNEDFWETLQRVVEGTFNIQKIHCRNLNLPWNEPKAQASAQDMFKRMWDFKFLPPGRGLWMMGTDLVYEKGGACLNNCAFVSTINLDTDFAEPFSFLMDMSMLGVGVGGDTKGKGKVKLHTPKISSEPFVVEDSREGWVELIRTVLNSFVGKGAYPGLIDYSQVRGRGQPIKGFGGVASGAAPLNQLVGHLTDLLLPQGVTATRSEPTVVPEDDTRMGVVAATFEGEGSPYRITSTIIVDAFNFIGKCVVAGGVRRTAEILFGDADDTEFMALKQDQVALMDRRWASNNSIFGTVGMDYTEVAKSLTTNGEPGVVWLENMRRFSRMGHPADNKDERALGSNPCVEQTLEDHELCCLVETYPAHHDSLEDYQKTLKMAYLYAKTVTLVPTHNPKTNAVMGRNRRIGCSMSGIVQAMNKLGRRQLLDWCDSGYTYIQELDKVYADWLCVPRSLKTTSVKPSGCLTPDTEIRTNKGTLSMIDLFGLNGVDLGEKAQDYREWYPVTEDLRVWDSQGVEQRITKLFVNGVEETLRLFLEDGTVLECTPDHKFLLADGTWKKARDLTEQDDLAVR